MKKQLMSCSALCDWLAVHPDLDAQERTEVIVVETQHINGGKNFLKMSKKVWLTLELCYSLAITLHEIAEILRNYALEPPQKKLKLLLPSIELELTPSEKVKEVGCFVDVPGTQVLRRRISIRKGSTCEKKISNC
jgi:hypothetical protein